MTASPTEVNYRSVAIVALSTEVPLGNFTRGLYQALSAYRCTVLFTSEVEQRSAESSNEEELESCPEQQAQHISLYQCDMCLTAWTRQCVSRADTILIIGQTSRGQKPKAK
jgi:lysophospholipid hydrolase